MGNIIRICIQTHITLRLDIIQHSLLQAEKYRKTMSCNGNSWWSKDDQKKEDLSKEFKSLNDGNNKMQQSNRTIADETKKLDSATNSLTNYLNNLQKKK